MKILLLGEYSNLHWTLAQGLRTLGHDVTVISSGDSFKSYNRDITLNRKSYGIVDTFEYAFSVLNIFRSLRNYDIVQIINPLFLNLKPQRNMQAFNYLKRHNGRVFLGAFGTDSFWVRACLDGMFRYSEFSKPEQDNYSALQQSLIDDWLGTDKETLCKDIASSADGIIACLYEYFESYRLYYPDKLAFIPEPVNTHELVFKQRGNQDVVNFFIGIQTKRSQFKGTDILYRVLQEVHSKYPKQSAIQKAESLPFEEYVKMMAESDVILDQLYSYTPAMNAFTAMAQGLVCVGGGEPEGYEILGEYTNRPIVNVTPDEEDIYKKLENLILNRQEIPELSKNSRIFVEKHHNYIKVAQQYVDFWTK
ncbi:glycosyltransferase [Dysgonomonas sp. 520]|uniref:glycosyltransferase family protein n=1 Tax=Dysgonomonas sp. 520 TaxID=2302931 RepID=UPI0013D12CD8|nr:glycosyltransferase [Dysgonomonas sp. 520]NDW08198.1 glycosyltransferase family 1 protein [Dysgonomonas sp. 520]